ncbi:MAG TPA: cupin domain-containing protein [Acidimicrobiales bacterium]|nr:cupin domain-containing protein [Acidimicrobiales bacterium]
MPFVRPSDMLAATPLPGWSGRFLHSANMTFAHYDIAADAVPLHEHQHEQEEVWHIVDGEVALTIDGEEQVLTAGCIAVVPPQTPHSVRPVGAVRVVIADYPLRPNLPGQSRAE